MQVEVQEKGALRRRLQIELSPDEVAGFIVRRLALLAQAGQIPGFRKGKAPLNVLYARYKKEIAQAVFEELVPETIERACEQERLRRAGPATIEGLEHGEGKPLSFAVEFDVWPEIDLADYEGAEVRYEVAEVTEEEVDRFLEELREHWAELPVVDRESGAGDIVEAEFHALGSVGEEDSEPRKAHLEAGSERLVEPLRRLSLGLRAGDEREVELVDESGLKRTYRMKVLNIREKKVPPLDDSFARRINPDFDLQALRRDVRGRIEARRRDEAGARMRQAIVDWLIQKNPFDVPESVIERGLSRLYDGQENKEAIDEEQFKRQYRSLVERLARRDYLLSRVAEREGIRVLPEDIERHLALLAMRQGTTIEKVRKQVDTDRIHDLLFEERVFEALRRKMKVEEVRIRTALDGGSEAPEPGKGPDGSESR